MSNLEILGKRVRDLNEYHFKEFEPGLLRQKAQFDWAAKFEKSPEKARRELLQSSGINLAPPLPARRISTARRPRNSACRRRSFARCDRCASGSDLSPRLDGRANDQNRA